MILEDELNESNYRIQIKPYEAFVGDVRETVNYNPQNT
jgi:hypothetical protein